MRRAVPVAMLALCASPAVLAGSLKADLVGLAEVPAISTPAGGEFRADAGATAISYKLSYHGLEGDVTQAHIHFGQHGANGGIAAFLCSNLGNGPAGTQLCPPSPATITGTVTAADIVGPSGQGIAAGEFAELLQAIDEGAAYANVHSTKFPGGEVRGQIKGGM
jgi:hypothetical protein